MQFIVFVFFILYIHFCLCISIIFEVLLCTPTNTIIDGAVLKSRKRKKPTFQEMQKKDFKCCIAYFDCKLNGF